MRVFILFVCALGIVISSSAQKSVLKAVPYGKTAHPTQVSIIDEGTPNSTVANPIIPPSRPKSIKATIDTTWVGSSINAYTLLIAQQRGLWYDKNLNAIMMDYRGNQGTTAYPKMAFLNGNSVANSYSLDQGATWVKKTGIMGVTGVTACRYPSGVISNPDGNTDINNSYAVMAGPATDGSAWVSSYYGSIKYDGTNADLQTVPQSMGELLRQGMTATEDGKVHFCGDGYTDDYLSSILMIKNGVMDFSTGIIDWTPIEISLDDIIARKAVDNTLITFFGDAHMAWNNDGSVGYVMVRGSDVRAADPTSWIPIFFKTVDGGESWNQLPYFDYSTLTEITDWILPVAGETDIYKPMFTDFALTVDNNNLPHLFAQIRGAASDDIDSLTYIWTYGTDAYDADCNFFEVWPTNASMTTWQAFHIDTCWSDDLTTTVSWYTSSTGNVTWDHRMQASRSYDGTRVYCTWTDSDYKFWGTKKYNLNPDLFAFGRCMNSNSTFGPTNMTYFTDAFGISFFHFTSPIAMIPSTADPLSTESIPVRISDIQSTGLNADNPTYHIYVKGIDVQLDCIYDGTNDMNPVAKFTQCYPNPSNGSSYVDLSLDKNSRVNLVITNVAGQTVSTVNYGMVNKGSRQLKIDNSILGSGVYFCTFTVGDQKYTSKMIVN
jgi:hypothetical protein